MRLNLRMNSIQYIYTYIYIEVWLCVLENLSVLATFNGHYIVHGTFLTGADCSITGSSLTSYRLCVVRVDDEQYYNNGTKYN